MPTLTFIADPSLEQRDSRKRGLLLSNVRSHTSKHRHHVNRKPNRGRGGRGISHRNQRNAGIDKDRRGSSRGGGSDAALPSEITMRLPQAITPRYSTYLQDSYTGKRAPYVNDLSVYFLTTAGPMYIWRLVSTEDERLLMREHIVNLYLSEPAFCEAILAWSQNQRDYARTGSNELSHAATYHQCKSLSFMRELLNKSNENDHHAHPWSILWTIVVQTLLSRICGDMKALHVNLKGLQSFVASVGGLNCLKRKSPRAYMLVRGLSKLPTNQVSDSRVSSVTKGSKRPFQDYTTRTSDHDPLGSGMPEELSMLGHKGKVRAAVLSEACTATALFARCRKVATNPSDEVELRARKFKAESALRDMIGDWTLSDTEYVICSAMMIKLATMPPEGEVGKVLTRGTIVVQFSDRLRSIAASSGPEARTPIIWASLVIWGLSERMAPGVVSRRFLLEGITDHLAPRTPWPRIRRELARIYLDSEMDENWRMCWEDVIMSD